MDFRSLERARFELRESSLMRPMRPRPISRLTRSAELEMSSLELSSVDSCHPEPDPKIAGQVSLFFYLSFKTILDPFVRL